MLRAGANSLTLTYTASGGNPAAIGLLYLADLEMALPEDPTLPATVERITTFDPSMPPRDRGTDYLIVTHGLFRAQAERLAAVKSSEGLHPLVVDVERAYDRFSGGIVEAGSIRRLIQSIGTPRYVLLLGDDTFDTHDYLGTGAYAFMPSLLALGRRVRPHPVGEPLRRPRRRRPAGRGHRPPARADRGARRP